MKSLVLRYLFCMCAVIGLTACGSGGPGQIVTGTSPSPVPVRVLTDLSIGCGEEVDGYSCTAAAHYSDDSSRDITGLATWSTSDPSIATIDSVGQVTVLRAGSVAFRVRYENLDAFVVMDVEVGGLRRYYYAISGWVTDARTGEVITNVAVRILDGPNAGRTGNTGNSGAYQIYDLALGSFTLQFSKPGYATVTRTATLTGTEFTDASVTMTP